MYIWQAGRFSWEADVLVGMFSYPLLCICFPGDRKVASDRCQSRIWCLQLVSSPSLHTGRDRGQLCVVKRDWSRRKNHVIWKAQSRKKKKSSHTFAHLVNFSKIVSSMFDNHTILLFWLWNKQTSRMFSLLNLCFVFCSLDLDVLCAQRIIGFFNLNYPQINETWKSAHVEERHITGPNEWTRIPRSPRQEAIRVQVWDLNHSPLSYELGALITWIDRAVFRRYTKVCLGVRNVLNRSDKVDQTKKNIYFVTVRQLHKYLCKNVLCRKILLFCTPDWLHSHRRARGL